MAIFRLSASIISRAKGRSATAAAAYRAGERIEDRRTGDVHDYSRKGAVEQTQIFAPDGTPDWMLDRAALWNAVEAVERRKDAQLAREIQLALPRELSSEQRYSLVREFVQSAFVAQGMIADVAIHNPPAQDGGEQPHAHVMLTMRALTGESFGAKERAWNSDELLASWRAGWAQCANQHLEQAGSFERIDHRSLVAQQADIEQRAEAAMPGPEQVALQIKSAELKRDPVPALRAAWHIEERARQRAANDNRVYQPVTDRGHWLEEFRIKAVQRMVLIRELAHVLSERAAQLWAQFTEQISGRDALTAKPIAAEDAARLSAADRLLAAEKIAVQTHALQADQHKSTAAQRLQQAEEIARARAGQKGEADQKEHRHNQQGFKRGEEQQR